MHKNPDYQFSNWPWNGACHLFSLSTPSSFHTPEDKIVSFSSRAGATADKTFNLGNTEDPFFFCYEKWKLQVGTDAAAAAEETFDLEAQKGPVFCKENRKL
jgi:hypothetical protein